MELLIDHIVSEKFTYLMNNVFDVLNGRFKKEAIFRDESKWYEKRKILQDFLNVLDNTEKLYVHTKSASSTNYTRDSHVILSCYDNRSIKIDPIHFHMNNFL